MRTISDFGISKIKEWEGFKNKVYKDVAGFLTIGVGHLLTRSELTSGKLYINEIAIRYNNGLTDQQVNDLLRQDLLQYCRTVESVKVPLNDNQFAALVSFTFNVGESAFKNSTLLKKLNAGLYVEVPAQLRRWTKAGGVDIPGLVNRRNHEIELWNLE